MSDILRCPVCRGKGIIPNPFPQSLDWKWKDIVWDLTCGTCHGLVEIIDKKVLKADE